MIVTGYYIQNLKRPVDVQGCAGFNTGSNIVRRGGLRTKAISQTTIIMTAALVAVLLSTDARAQPEPNSTQAGNYLAGRHADAKRDLDAAAVYLGAALAEDENASQLVRRIFLINLYDGRVEKAIELAERVLALRGEDANAALTLAIDALKSGDYDTVAHYLDRLEGAGFGRIIKPLLAAWALTGQAQTEAALAALSPLANIDGARPLHDTHAALINTFAGKYEKAIDLMVLVMEQQGGFSVRTTELIGGIHEAAGDARSAEAIYSSFRTEFPDSPLMRNALERIANGKPGKFEIATPADGMAEGLYSLALAFNQQNATEQALLLAQLAQYMRPDFPGLQLITGNLVEHQYGPARANAVYETISRDSDYAWTADLRRAGNLAELGRSDEAEALLRALAKQDTSAPDPMIDLGDLMRTEARFEDAVDAYDEAFARIEHPGEEYWSLYYARGIALERAKMWDRAEKDLLQALAYKPDQPLVLNYLGYSWLEFGTNLEEALDMIRRAVALRPNDGYIIDSLGWGFYQLGRFEEAVRELERAVEHRPEDPVINDHLGDAYWQVGRQREARFQWQRALNLEPDDDLIPVIEDKLENGLETETASGTDS